MKRIYFFTLFILLTLSPIWGKALRSKIIVYPPDTAFVIESHSHFPAALPQHIIQESLQVLSENISNWSITHAMQPHTPFLENFIGKPVKLLSDHQIRDMTFIGSKDNQLLFQNDQGIFINPAGELLIPNAQVSLYPTLLIPNAKKAASIRIAYLTHSINSHLYYIAHINQAHTKLTLTGYLSLQNQDKDFYPEIIEVSTAKLNPPKHPIQPRLEAAHFKTQMKPNDTVTPHGEHYQYPIKNAIPILAHDHHTLRFMPVQTLDCKKKYQFTPKRVYWRTENPQPSEPINIILWIKTQKIPLAQGPITLYQNNAPLGNSRLQNISAHSEAYFNYSTAFDITGKKIKLDQSQLHKAAIEETYQIQLTNAKKTAVTIEVIDTIHSQNWKLKNFPFQYKKVSATQIRYHCDIPAQDTLTFDYVIEKITK